MTTPALRNAWSIALCRRCRVVSSSSMLGMKTRSARLSELSPNSPKTTEGIGSLSTTGSSLATWRRSSSASFVSDP